MVSSFCLYLSRRQRARLVWNPLWNNGNQPKKEIPVHWHRACKEKNGNKLNIYDQQIHKESAFRLVHRMVVWYIETSFLSRFSLLRISLPLFVTTMKIMACSSDLSEILALMIRMSALLPVPSLAWENIMNTRESCTFYYELGFTSAKQRVGVWETPSVKKARPRSLVKVVCLFNVQLLKRWAEP